MAMCNRKTMRVLVIACVIGMLGGCGSKNTLVEIGGNATYDGKPIEKGLIRFLPVDGATPTAAAEIANGRYTVKVSPGKKQVQIESYKVVGQHYHRNDPNDRLLDTLEQILPDRYNVNSELTCDIEPGERVYDFTLSR
jgi:hypothetical protein